MSANPAGTPTLNLDEEAREIEAKIRGADYRESLELITKWAIRPNDLLQALNQHKPHIVHFSGHGSPTEEIILLDDQREPKPVTKEALVSLFHALKDNILLVVLNACFSRPQAEAITQEIDCVIGMSRAIGDEAAITFAASFYRAIGFGRSVKQAFDQGKTALLLDGIREQNTPALLTREHVDPNNIFPLAGRDKAPGLLDEQSSVQGVSDDAWWGELEDVAAELFAAGPTDDELWSRAGGDVARLRPNLAGRAAWHAALRELRSGGGGRKITVDSLLTIMHHDFPNNSGLVRLQRLRSRPHGGRGD
jgi:hypothetical protein